MCESYSKDSLSRFVISCGKRCVVATVQCDTFVMLSGATPKNIDDELVE